MGAEVDETGTGMENIEIVDCDLHLTEVPDEELRPYLPPRYKDRGVTIPTSGYAHPHGRRISDTGQGWSESNTPENMQSHLDTYGIDCGIVTGSTHIIGLSQHPNRDYAVELARAHNEFVAEEWLSVDDRLFASIVVPPQDPSEAVELIKEFGERPRFVQVIMGSGCDYAYGHEKFWPIYRAAVEHNLPVAIHPSHDGAGIGHMQSPPSNYFELHNQYPMRYMTHVNSLIVEGVFEKFQNLEFICIEGGFAWVPQLMWRMDKNWRGLRDQAPWLTQPPSDYIRENVRFTTQPMVEPETDDQLLSLLKMMHAEDVLMFSSDFPHWDGDDPTLVLPHSTPAAIQENILYRTAIDTYSL